MPTKEPFRIEITQKTITNIFLIAIVLVLVYFLRSIVALIFGSYIVFSALNPIVDKLNKFEFRGFKLSRGLAIFTVFISFLAVFGLLLWAIIGPTYSEIGRFFGDFEQGIQTISEKYRFEEILGKERSDQIKSQFFQEVGNFASEFTNNPQNLLNIGRGLAEVLLSAITFIAILFYQLTNPKRIHNFLVSFFDDEKKGKRIISDIETKLGSWLQGQFSLMLIMGVLSYIGFRIIGVPFALPLAFLVGLTDILPIVGPSISFAFSLVVILAFGEPWQLVAALALLLILQQAEAQFLVPKVMENSVGLDPIVVILALMIGATLMGATGAILSVPFTAILMIIYQEWQSEKKKRMLNKFKERHLPNQISN